MKLTRSNAVHTARGRSRRVLVVSPQPFYAERGTPIAVRDVCIALVELGFQVDLLTLPVGEHIDLRGVNIIRVENPFAVDSMPIGFSKHKLVFDLLILRKLRELVRENSYYRIHAVEEAVYLAQLTPGIDSDSIVYDMASSLAQHFDSGLISNLLAMLEAMALRRVGYVICSAGLGKRVQTRRAIDKRKAFHEWSFPPPPVTGRPIPEVTLRNALGLSDEHRVLLYAGSLAKYQGFDKVLEAIPFVLERDRKAVFVIVGGSELESCSLVSSVPSRHRARVRVIPKLPRAVVADFYPISDILLSPRAECDNAPLKIFEYLAAGRAVVASDVVGHRAVLNDDLAAFYSDDGKSLGEVLVGLLKNDKARERLARTAACFAAEQLGWHSFRDSIKRAYPLGAPNIANFEISLRSESLTSNQHIEADEARVQLLEVLGASDWSQPSSAAAQSAH